MTNTTIPEKSLCLIPQRFQIAMVDAGWLCRNTIIWYKPNCMPSSAKDRFTVDFEYLFFFTKSQRYYFETQYEPLEPTPASLERYKYKLSPRKRDSNIAGREGEDNRLHNPDNLENVRQNMLKSLGMWPKIGGNKAPGYGNPVYSGNQPPINQLGRIKRCVWKIPTQPFSEAHFAVFPPAIVETPLKATCPEYVCKKCGRPREKIVEKEYSSQRPPSTTERMKGGYWKTYEKSNYRNMRVSHGIITAVNELGWNQCDCNTGFDGGIVLDPFMGSGTVALVAMQNARNFIGIELNEEYIKMAKERLEPYLLQTRLPI